MFRGWLSSLVRTSTTLFIVVRQATQYSVHKVLITNVHPSSPRMTVPHLRRPVEVLGDVLALHLVEGAHLLPEVHLEDSSIHREATLLGITQSLRSDLLLVQNCLLAMLTVPESGAPSDLCVSSVFAAPRSFFSAGHVGSRAVWYDAIVRPARAPSSPGPAARHCCLMRLIRLTQP